MSQKQQHHEAVRWLTTAQEDLKAAQLLKDQKMYSHSCFLAQQCAEKALKALWQELDEDPWGHSIQKLMRDLPQDVAKEKFVPLIEKAATLDRFLYSCPLSEWTAGFNARHNVCSGRC
ncbi:MAG: HEPN domain-containing protein [Spartobacteria bacterium]|nr:HEPN domain-containing protein [Spartobacteria bacterium]